MIAEYLKSFDEPTTTTRSPAFAHTVAGTSVLAISHAVVITPRSRRVDATILPARKRLRCMACSRQRTARTAEPMPNTIIVEVGIRAGTLAGCSRTSRESATDCSRCAKRMRRFSTRFADDYSACFISGRRS